MDCLLKSVHGDDLTTVVGKEDEMMIYKAYYFDGQTTDSMVKIYEGSNEERAFEKIEPHEKKGRQVEIWEGDENDSATDTLIYP